MNKKTLLGLLTTTMMMTLTMGALARGQSSAGPGGAGETSIGPPHRFHPLTRELNGRLRPKTRAAIPAVALHLSRKLGQAVGTAYLVHPGLLRMAAHGAPSPGDPVVFTTENGRVAARVTRVLCSSSPKKLDYVLAAVEGVDRRSSAALRRIKPLELGAGYFDQRASLVTIGYPNLGKLRLEPPSERYPSFRRRVSLPRSLDLSDPNVKGALMQPRLSIQVGEQLPTYGPTGPGGALRSLYNLPATVGSSGSPILDRRTHRVLGTVSGQAIAGLPGGAVRVTNGVPTLAMLADVSRQLKAGTVAAQDRRLVGQWLTRVGEHLAPERSPTP